MLNSPALIAIYRERSDKLNKVSKLVQEVVDAAMVLDSPADFDWVRWYHDAEALGFSPSQADLLVAGAENP